MYLGWDIIFCGKTEKRIILYVKINKNIYEMKFFRKLYNSFFTLVAKSSEIDMSRAKGISSHQFILLIHFYTKNQPVFGCISLPLVTCVWNKNAGRRSPER